MSRMMIMAGGTGGHVMPALAVASVLLRENIEISWIGTRDGLEATLVPEANIDFDEIDIKGLRRSGIVRKLLMPFMLLKAMIQTLELHCPWIPAIPGYFLPAPVCQASLRRETSPA